MSIFLGRHALSAGNLDPIHYALLGDPNVPVVPHGTFQAERMGRFFAEYCKQHGIDEIALTYASSYLRPQHTLKGMFNGMAGNGPLMEKFHQDFRLIEQSFGVLPLESMLETEEQRAFWRNMIMLSQAAYKTTPFSAAPPFGESPKNMLINTKSFIDGTFARDIQENPDKDFFIMSHGAVMKAFLMNWFHLPITAWKELETPGNCDLYVIDGAPKKWQVRKIFNGETGEKCDIDPIAHIVRPTFANLPEPPPALERI